MRGNKVVCTNSELATLRSCPWKHRLKYELMLDPVGGQDRTGARNVGSLVHLGIAEVYRHIQSVQWQGGQPTKATLHTIARAAVGAAVAEAWEETAMFEGAEADALRSAEVEDAETATRCLELFVDHIALPLMSRYIVLGVEVPFRVPVLTRAGRRSGDELEGVFDLVLFDIHLRKVVLSEHKTTSGDASTYEVKLATGSQIPLYIYALRQIFGAEMVAGTVVLNVIRKAYPKKPKTNRDGSVSTAEVDTTRDVYQAALDTQAMPKWWSKASLEYEEATEEVERIERTLARQHGPLNKEAQRSRERAARRLEKAKAAFEKAQERLHELEQKQRARLETLPDISRFVYQFEEQVSDLYVERAQRDAWTGARLIRLFRRGALEPWRNGGACRAFGRVCELHEACVEGIEQPGELLVRRSVRHAEVEEARQAAHPGLKETLERYLSARGHRASP